MRRSLQPGSRPLPPTAPGPPAQLLPSASQPRVRPATARAPLPALVSDELAQPGHAPRPHLLGPACQRPALLPLTPRSPGTTCRQPSNPARSQRRVSPFPLPARPHAPGPSSSSRNRCAHTGLPPANLAGLPNSGADAEIPALAPLNRPADPRIPSTPRAAVNPSGRLHQLRPTPLLCAAVFPSLRRTGARPSCASAPPRR